MIIVRLRGGMGNQMFEYAAARALSLQKKVPLGLDLSYLKNRTPRFFQKQFTFRKYELGVFNIEAKIVIEKEIPFVFRDIAFLGIFWPITDRIRTTLLKSERYLTDYFQSAEYFAGYEEIIRKDFSFKIQFSENIEKKAEEISSVHSVCIHVRRTDFLHDTIRSVCSIEYYKLGIEKIAETETIEKIFVFSDDSEWCKENLSFEYPVEFMDSNNKGYEDMYLMSKGKHFVIANSSFSWWSAWLSENPSKIVVAPKHWLVNSTTENIIPKDWIKI